MFYYLTDSIMHPSIKQESAKMRERSVYPNTVRRSLLVDKTAAPNMLEARPRIPTEHRITPCLGKVWASLLYFGHS